MPTIKSMRVSNSQLQNLNHGMVAVFAGGTSGIGKATCVEFVRHTVQPTVYIIGRNELCGSKIVEEFREVNHAAKVHFLPSDLTLIRNVDDVCRLIKEKEVKVNLLFMSINYLTWTGRDETSEGLDKMFSLQYYARMRFVFNLLPHLNSAAHQGELARVLSYLMAGHEGRIFKEDLLLKQHFSFSTCSGQSSAMTSLALHRLATDNPNITFIHICPGFVRGTNISNGMGPIVRGFGSIFSILTSPFSGSLKDSAAMHLYVATNDSYLSYGQSGPCNGSAALRLDWCGEPYKESALLNSYRGDGTGDQVWDHTMSVFSEIVTHGMVN